MKKKKVFALAIALSVGIFCVPSEATEYLVPSGSIFENQSSKQNGTIFNIAIGDSLIIEESVQFINNSTTKHGGVISSKGDLIITGATFEGNKGNSNYSLGGAILTGGIVDATVPESEWTFTGSAVIKDSLFKNNKSSYGAAIYNQNRLIVDNTKFIGNEIHYFNDAWSSGAAIDNNNRTTAVMHISNSFFEDNKNGSSQGAGAIFFGTLSTEQSTIENCEFVNNSSEYRKYTVGGETGKAGAIEIDSGSLLINNSIFAKNIAEEGGAIYKWADKGAELIVNNSIFEKNIGTVNGGAIYNNANGVANGSIILENVTMKSNTTAGNGGAIYNSSDIVIRNLKAIENKATTLGSSNGGAVYSNGGNVLIENSEFVANTAAGNGGAIYVSSNNLSRNASQMQIKDSDFIDNSSDGNGGAIYADSSLSIIAENKNVLLSGNKDNNGSNDIYMSNAASTLNINANMGRTVTVESGIAGGAGYSIDVSGNGTFEVKSIIADASSLNIGTGSTLWLNTGSQLRNVASVNMADNSNLNTINNKIDTYSENQFNATGVVQVSADVNSQTGNGDNIGAAVDTSNGGKISINKINDISGNITENTSFNVYDALGLSSDNVSFDNLELKEIMSPIRKFKGSVNSTTGMLSYVPTGNSYNDFNPAVMVSPVAAQLGGITNQLNSYDEAFRTMDTYMYMPKNQRQALKNTNKYASNTSTLAFSKSNSPYSDKAGWFRPYTTFENIKLDNGPKVSNVMWGSYAGLESGIKELGNGWDGMLGIYAGYNGSHQAFQGNSIYQNGGTLGLSVAAYKGNFFTGLTANVGANVAEASNLYGSEDFTMLMTGIASKSGYNFEFKDGKFIVQPSFMMAYSMINTFDYTNAANVRITSDPLHAITFEPGVKFIANLRNGWQPYAGVSVVLNALNDTQFKANDVSLPDLSIDPYAKYGVGVRKTWEEKFTGLLQAFVTSGGRNGVGLQGGFRWRLGDESSKTIN